MRQGIFPFPSDKPATGVRQVNVQHSCAKSTWYTPDQYIAAARQVFGGKIDLDPASDAHGNATVGARRYITATQDGTLADWGPQGHALSVWMNPPGRVARKKDEAFADEHRPLPELFWLRLMGEVQAGRVSHAIVAAFSLEQLQQSQSWHRKAMLDFPVCYPAQRVRWQPGQAAEKTSPTHAAAFVYVPGTVDRTDEFRRVFGYFGRVVVPAPTW